MVLELLPGTLSLKRGPILLVPLVGRGSGLTPRRCRELPGKSNEVSSALISHSRFLEELHGLQVHCKIEHSFGKYKVDFSVDNRRYGRPEKLSKCEQEMVC